jgi:hypothetical protein
VPVFCGAWNRLRSAQDQNEEDQEGGQLIQSKVLFVFFFFFFPWLQSKGACDT